MLIAGFLDECCLLASNARYPALELYLSYVGWCLDQGVPVQDQFTFLEELRGIGLKYRQRRSGEWLKGIAVLPRYRIPV